jgi:hypothetical protein
MMGRLLDRRRTTQAGQEAHASFSTFCGVGPSLADLRRYLLPASYLTAVVARAQTRSVVALSNVSEHEEEQECPVEWKDSEDELVVKAMVGWVVALLGSTGLARRAARI